MHGSGLYRPAEVSRPEEELGGGVAQECSRLAGGRREKRWGNRACSNYDEGILYAASYSCWSEHLTSLLWGHHEQETAAAQQQRPMQMSWARLQWTSLFDLPMASHFTAV